MFEINIYLFRVSANIATCRLNSWDVCKVVTGPNSHGQEVARSGTMKVVLLSGPVNLKF